MAVLAVMKAPDEPTMEMNGGNGGCDGGWREREEWFEVDDEASRNARGRRH